MPSVDFAYAAGIMDGEGSFMLLDRGPHGREKNRSTYPMVVVCMTDSEVPNFMRDLFGGVVTRRPGRTPAARDTYWWRGSRSTCERCVRAVLPYLKIKQRQAELMLAFLGDTEIREKNGITLTTRAVEKRAWYAKEMSALNQRRAA